MLVPTNELNITKALEKALKSLGEDSSTRLVVMNANDYSDKFLEHLQDKNSYKWITDRRKNSTANTEKELNKLLQEIKV